MLSSYPVSSLSENEGLKEKVNGVGLLSHLAADKYHLQELPPGEMNGQPRVHHLTGRCGLQLYSKKVDA